MSVEFFLWTSGTAPQQSLSSEEAAELLAEQRSSVLPSNLPEHVCMCLLGRQRAPYRCRSGHAHAALEQPTLGVPPHPSHLVLEGSARAESRALKTLLAPGLCCSKQIWGSSAAFGLGILLNVSWRSLRPSAGLCPCGAASQAGAPAHRAERPNGQGLARFLAR